jgi:hypothetical protein
VRPQLPAVAFESVEAIGPLTVDIEQDQAAEWQVEVSGQHQLATDLIYCNARTDAQAAGGHFVFTIDLVFGWWHRVNRKAINHTVTVHCTIDQMPPFVEKALLDAQRIGCQALANIEAVARASGAICVVAALRSKRSPIRAGLVGCEHVGSPSAFRAIGEMSMKNRT